MIMIEFDLAGAEWVVVAYLSQDANMLDVVQSGRSPHIVTGALISGAPETFVEEESEVVGSNTDASTILSLREKLIIPEGIFLPRVMSIRQAGKKSNHGLNYNMKFRRFALENEMLEADAEPICDAYVNKAYPGIKNYWKDVRAELSDNKRTLVNCFGRKVKLRGEWGEELFNQAYSFKPQSTVVDICNAAMKKAYFDESVSFQRFYLGAQVHDSLQIQTPIPESEVEWQHLIVMCLRIKEEYMRPIVHYNQDFRLNCDMKMGLNWGDMHKVKIGSEKDMGHNIDVMRIVLDVASSRKEDPSLEASLEVAPEEMEIPPQDPQLGEAGYHSPQAVPYSAL